MTRVLTLVPFLTLFPCTGGPGDTDSSTTTVPSTGTATDPACEAVWDVPFRTPDPVTCYGSTTGGTPSCYGCFLIRPDQWIRAESDLVEINQDAVTCSGGVFTSLGADIATYDPLTGELSPTQAYASTFIEDDLGVCAGLLSF